METEPATAPSEEPPAVEPDDAPPPAPDEEPDETPAEEPQAPPSVEPAVDLDAGWRVLDDFTWPLTVGCCDAPTTGPISPQVELPSDGWPADGLYDVEAQRRDPDAGTLHLVVRPWVRPEELPEHWAEIPDVIEGDASHEVVRDVAYEDLEVVLIPITAFEASAPAAITGEGSVLARSCPRTASTSWNAVTLEVRDGMSVLYLWAGQVAG